MGFLTRQKKTTRVETSVDCRAMIFATIITPLAWAQQNPTLIFEPTQEVLAD